MLVCRGDMFVSWQVVMEEVGYSPSVQDDRRSFPN